MTKGTAEYFNEGKGDSDPAMLISAIYDLIETNWRNHGGGVPSHKLWVPRMTWTWSGGHKAFEVPLERALVSIYRFQRLIDAGDVSSPLWFNQIPVAAGLVRKPDGKDAGEGKRCVDLVYRKSLGKYDFVELKYARDGNGGDTPLGAAVAILKYGAAYLLTVTNRAELERKGWEREMKDWFLTGDENNVRRKATSTELHDATDISLCVLAPRHFYHQYELQWLAGEIDAGLGTFVKDLSQRINKTLPRMSFQFEYFDEPFKESTGNDFKFNFTRHPVPVRWSKLNQDLR